MTPFRVFLTQPFPAPGHEAWRVERSCERFGRITRHSETGPILVLRAGSPVPGDLAGLRPTMRSRTLMTFHTTVSSAQPNPPLPEPHGAIESNRANVAARKSMSVNRQGGEAVKPQSRRRTEQRIRNPAGQSEIERSPQRRSQPEQISPAARHLPRLPCFEAICRDARSLTTRRFSPPPW